MNRAVVAYVPVLHEGYRRFFEHHARDRPIHLIGRALHTDYRPLAKDIRALDPMLVRAAVESWGVGSSVEILDDAGAERLAAGGAALTLPSEDVSYQVVERFFSRNQVTYDSVFLRWDKRRTVEMLRPTASPLVPSDHDFADLASAAEAEAGGSIDWWRQVGAAIRFTDGTVVSARNEANPRPDTPYAVGDPRSNFFKGVHLELSLATHAEARLIANAARQGRATEGASMYVTDFPCPPCAKLIAGAGISRLYFRSGYAVLDGEDVLHAAGVELIDVSTSSVAG